MDDDRRAARAWAEEWQIRQKNKRIIRVIAGIAIVILIIFAIRFWVIHATRMTFSSKEEMRAALQGRFETDYAEDIEIIGDDITLTYYEISHYDPDYAEEYGYSEYDDYVCDDTVSEWDYRHGVIKGRWMSDIIVDKDGNLVYYSTTFVRSYDDKPVPFDPSILSSSAGGSELSEEEEAALEDALESREKTEEDLEEAEEEGLLAADAAGI